MVDQTSQFYAILTNVGAAKQANADALGIPWKITQMGVGDANGTDPTPNATQTGLINEWRRAPLNQLKVDDKNSAIIIAEQVIPADVGGKWIREIALYDADGDMVAVANCAPTYKPLLSQGSGRTQVVRMNLVVSSASNVQLKIDPAVVLATREWVAEELALKAPLASPVLTGIPTVPTAESGSDSAQIANTAFVSALMRPLGESLSGKADKADSLVGYGITDKVQIQQQPLIGAFTVECLDATDFGQISGVLIKTRIPANQHLMPNLTIKGGLGGYNEPFEMQLAWYFWEGAIYMPRMLVGGTAIGLDNDVQVYLSYADDVTYIRIAFGSTIYLPRLAITAFKGKGYGGDYSMYEGWSSTPFSSAIDGEVQVKRTAMVNSANLPRNTGSVAGSGWWRCGDTGLIRQWGLTKGAAFATDYRTFPISFPQRCVSLVASRTSVWNLDAATGTNTFVASNSQFAVISGPYDSPDDIYWEAVGY